MSPSHGVRFSWSGKYRPDRVIYRLLSTHCAASTRFSRHGPSGSHAPLRAPGADGDGVATVAYSHDNVTAVASGEEKGAAARASARASDDKDHDGPLTEPADRLLQQSWWIHSRVSRSDIHRQ